MARKPKEAAPEVAPMLSLIDQDTTEGGALVVVENASPEEQARTAAALVYVNPARFDQFYDRMREETAKHVPDVSTAKGRAEIASLAFRVTKTKTSLDKAGLGLTEEWRAKTKAVNDARKPIVERLDKLAEEVRKPLTDWENAEAARVAANSATLQEIRVAATVNDDDTSGTVEERGKRIFHMTFDAPQWTDDERAEAEGAKQATVQALVAARNRLRQAEAEAAELAALRAERDARQARERQEAQARDLAPEAVKVQALEDEAATTIDDSIIADLIADNGLPAELASVTAAAAAPLWSAHLVARAERLERERREAEEAAEREREAAAQRERDEAARLEREREEAAAKARQEAEERAAEEKREREAEHARQLAAEREKSERIAREAREAEEKRRRDDEAREAAAQAERERVAAEQAEAARQEEARKAAERKRQADAEHRRAVLADVAADIMSAIPGLSDDMARDIANAIGSGQLRNVEVSF